LQVLSITLGEFYGSGYSIRNDKNTGRHLDPIAHTLTGAALAASGLKRATPLATAALLIGANAPDIDVVSYVGSPFESLAFRRGWTHGVLALAILPFAITGLILAWDRLVRRKREPAAEPARAGPLFGLALLAVLTHPALDWLNNYGMRWLMPFDGRWFYGDAVFIIDPWIWLGLGGALFLVHSRRAASLAGWSVFWMLASVLVLTAGDVPLASGALWLIGVAAAFLTRRFVFAAPDPDAAARRAVRLALGVGALYIGTLALTDLAERSLARAELAARGIWPVERVMIAPVAANPFAGEVVAETESAYYVGRWDWLKKPRLDLVPEPIPKRVSGPLFAAAARTPEARRFLTWARFPYIDVESDADGHVVSFLDARYHATGRLYGPTVNLDVDLELKSER
jgi:inner membrane protein